MTDIFDKITRRDVFDEVETVDIFDKAESEYEVSSPTGTNLKPVGDVFDQASSVAVASPGPEQTPVPLDQFKIYKMLEGMPAELAAGLKKAALEYDREGGPAGSIRMPETSIPKTLAEGFKNIPRNVKDIVKETSSMMMLGMRGAYGLGKNAVKDLNEALTNFFSNKEELLPESRVAKQVSKIKDFPAAVSDAISEQVELGKSMGIEQYLHKFVRNRPVDALFVARALQAGASSGVKLTLKGARKVAKNGTKFADGIDNILSTDRTPLYYDMPVEIKRGGPQASKITSSQATAKAVKFPRQYSKDPLIKYAFQKSFDKFLDNPKRKALKQSLGEFEGGRYLTELRKTYDSANVQQRIEMHKLIDDQLSTLTKDELKVMVPYLEGRASLFGKASKEFEDFEGWYRSTMKNAESDLISRGVLEPKRIDELIHGPLMKATGQTIDEVKSEFGNFTPAYVHEYHTKYPKKTSVEFADTVGKRYKPGILKRRQKTAVGDYSENLKEILPKWSSEYIKFKNTEAFVNELTSKFGIRANLQNIKQVEGGLKVGDKTYRGYKIIAPDGYLRFYKGQVDVYKEVSKKLDDLEFDEAIGTTIKETVGDVKETSRVIEGVAEATSRQAKLIEDRVLEALNARGFGAGEATQMLERVKTGGLQGIKTIVNEKEYTKIKEIIKTSGIDPDTIKDVFKGAKKDYLGVAKNQTVYLVPEKIAENLESWAAPRFGSQKIHNFLKLVYDKPVGVWKDSVLAASPRWIKNNVVGDVIFNSMEGVGPLSYSRAFSAKYSKLIPEELSKASFAETMKYNPKLGLAARSQFGQMAEKLGKTKIVKGVSKVKDGLYAVNTAFEQPFVRSLYIKEARDLATKLLRKENKVVNEHSILYKMEEIKNSQSLKTPIIKKVKETLPVFDLSGNFERKYLKGVMPFYNWYKFMALYGAKLPAKHPFKLVGARGLGALSEIEREQAFAEMFPFMKDEIEANGIPNKYDHLWPIEYPDENNEAKFFNARGMNPFTTLTDFSEGEFTNLLSPVIKIGLERSIGRDLYFGREFKDAEQGREKFREYEKVTPPLGDHVLSQFPQYKLLKQHLVPAQQWSSGTILNPDPILDKITGEYKYPIKSVEKVLNYVGIDKKTIDIKKTWQQFQRNRNRAIGETFDKDQAKYETHLSPDEIVQVLDYIKSDPETWDKIINKIKSNKKMRVQEKVELMKKLKGD